jgi:hypothetical protein
MVLEMEVGVGSGLMMTERGIGAFSSSGTGEREKRGGCLPAASCQGGGRRAWLYKNNNDKQSAAWLAWMYPYQNKNTTNTEMTHFLRLVLISNTHKRKTNAYQ